MDSEEVIYRVDRRVLSGREEIVVSVLHADGSFQHVDIDPKDISSGAKVIYTGPTTARFIDH